MEQSRKNILIIGSGMCSMGVINYLIRWQKNFITIGTNQVSQGKALASKYPSRISVRELDVKNENQLGDIVKIADIVISYVPFFLHGYVIQQCVKYKKNLVSASYNKDFIQFEKEVKDSGITILGEMGVDPGIDHMSALEFIDKILKRGGKITSYKSWCGGLPNIDSCYNPIGYKFSWSPRTALEALQREAKFIENGQEETIKGEDLLYRYKTLKFNQALNLDCYPNGVSTHYKEKYGLTDCNTLIRGTLRYPGYSFIMRSFCRIGLFLDTKITTLIKGDYYTWSSLITALIRNQKSISMKQLTKDQINSIISNSNTPKHHYQLASSILHHVFSHPHYLNYTSSQLLPLCQEVLKAMVWFRFFDDSIKHTTSCPCKVFNYCGKQTVFGAICAYFKQVLKFEEGETDVIYMQHDITAKFQDGHSEQWKLNMVAMGTEEISAMALTVGTPTAIAAQLILDGVITKKGLIDPTTKDIYEPVMKELSFLKIKFKEIQIQ